MTKLKEYSIGCIVGTRSEAIKIAPILFELKADSWAKISLISTGEQEKHLEDTFAVFDVIPNWRLNKATTKQTPKDYTARLYVKLNLLLKKHHFDVLLAVGSTTTVFVSSLIAFYHHIAFGHLEAGLRTSSYPKPFPYEMHRILTAPLSTWHFAPSYIEKENLLRENISANRIFVTGSTVTDALHWIIKNKPESQSLNHVHNFIIVSTHQHSDEHLKNICSAIIELSKIFDDINFLFILPDIPELQQTIKTFFLNQPRVHLLPSLRYDEFVYLMRRAILILTDSVTIQEEAPALHKPVLILNDTTNRPQILQEGIGLLVGTATSNIMNVVSQLLTDGKLYLRMTRSHCPEADEHAAKRIAEILKVRLPMELANI